MFRNHGITTDHQERLANQTWEYQMVCLGMNYRLTDFQCALGLSQLRKLQGWVTRRQAIASQYDKALATIPGIYPVPSRSDVSHAYHLYVIQVEKEKFGVDRATLFSLLREQGIGVQVHYIPVHLQPFYQNQFGTGPGLCPIAEAAYEKMLSLPIYPLLQDQEVDGIVEEQEVILANPAGVEVSREVQPSVSRNEVLQKSDTRAQNPKPETRVQKHDAG